MPIPTPRKGESKEDFVSRCVSFLHHENPNRSNDQNLAIAYDAWRKSSRAEASLTFNAMVHRLDADETGRQATFYLMNTSKNRIGWGVSDKALEEALPSLLGKSICCGEGYVQGHKYEPMEVGKWVQTDKPNGYALTTAMITDDHVWQQLSSGGWGPISVVVDVYDVNCTHCGEGLLAGSYQDHKCVKNGEGYALIESFTFSRVDFVDVPAFPQADMVSLNMLAQFYASQSKGQANVSLNHEGFEKKLEPIDEVKAELETLKAGISGLPSADDFAALKTAVETITAGLEKPADDNKDDDKVNPEIEELKAEMKTLRDERHAERVGETLGARIKAGLVPDPAKETERLMVLDATALTILRLDAEAIVEKREKAPPAAPKAAVYSAEESTELEEAMKKMRGELHIPNLKAVV